MTRADRVLSTPPTNTPALPVDTTRRHLLTIAVSGAVAAAIPAATLAATSAVDPIFAAINEHKKAHAAHLAAIKEVDRLHRIHGEADESITDKPCDDENDAFEALVSAAATTLPGLIAWLDYLQELGSEFETESIMTDRTCAAALVDSFVTSLKNIGVQA